MKPETLFQTLQRLRIAFFTGVPDSLLSSVSAYMADHAEERKHIIATNEGAAIGIACGYHLATGQIPLVYMQNSGIGNSVNPLLSLADENVYKIPMLLLVGWRGEPNVQDEPQHIKQGKVTCELLETMGIPYEILSFDETEGVNQIEQLVDQAGERSSPHALVIRKNTFDCYALQRVPPNTYPMSREEALKVVIDNLSATDIVVSTTGKLSRELFEYREQQGHGHTKDFLTVGSMGHSAAIALGIAIEKPHQKVYCLDGDGAALMHLGTQATIGIMHPPNFVHILFNNGAHESVGGQPTVGFDVHLSDIAKGCGYSQTLQATTSDELKEAVQILREPQKSPLFLEIRVQNNSRTDLGRPTTAPEENKQQFMKFLAGETK